MLRYSRTKWPEDRHHTAFVQELSKVNWNWTMKQANEWIEWYVTTFRDVSTQEGENRTFQLFNPNGGL
jgi:hypothetical protein